jgi:hypothetical protein
LRDLYLDPLYAIAVHPYGQAPTREWDLPGPNFGYVGDLLDAYQALLPEGKQLWVTEYGANENELGKDVYTRYVAGMTRALKELHVPYAFHFCLSDEMVPRFGLLSAGTEKAAYGLFKEVAEETEEPEPEPEPGGSQMKLEEYLKLQVNIGRVWGPISTRTEKGADGQIVTLRTAACEAGVAEERSWTETDPTTGQKHAWVECWSWENKDFPQPRRSPLPGGAALLPTTALDAADTLPSP